MEIHSVHKMFWHVLMYPEKPPVLTEKSETQETESPFRYGYGRVFRVPFTRKALVIGVWKGTSSGYDGEWTGIRRTVDFNDLNWESYYVQEEDY